MTVKRYAMINHGSGCLSIGEWDGGEYVKYEDYAALAVESGIMRQLLPDYVSVPVTDAAIRELQAKAINDAANFMQLSGAINFGECYVSLHKFAAKLRNGEVG